MKVDLIKTTMQADDLQAPLIPKALCLSACGFYLQKHSRDFGQYFILKELTKHIEYVTTVSISDQQKPPFTNITILNMTGNIHINVTMRRVCVTTVAVEKQQVCEFVALRIQHTMGKRHIVICGMPGSTMFFSHYLINSTIFGKKLVNPNCVF
jgi:hypothetical protein